MNNKNETISLIIGLFLGFLIGGFIFSTIQNGETTKRIQKEAIENGVGQYNPRTGNFEWKLDN